MTEAPPFANEPTLPVVARPLGITPPPPPSDLELPHIRRGDALLDLALVFLAAIVLPYLPSVLAPLGGEEVEFVKVGPLVIIQTWCQAGLAGALLLYFVLRHGIRSASFGLRRDRVGLQVLWGIGTLVGVYGAVFTSGLLVVVIYLVSPELEDDLTKRLEFAEQMPVDSLGTSLILLLAVALNEEIVFRGLLLPYLRRVLGSWWWAGALSAWVFASLHVPQQGLLGGLQIFAVGAMLAVFFVLSRSLLAVTLAHLLFDFLQFQLSRVAPHLKELLEHLQG
jgi:membrane protease YdiL (CAAX protease family)